MVVESSTQVSITPSTAIAYRIRGLVPQIIPLIVIIVAAISAALILGGSYNNDQWFMAATGRWIVEHHRVPYSSGYFSAYGGRMIAQQWAWCIIIWVVWSHGGYHAMMLFWAGLMVLMALTIVSTAGVIRGGTLLNAHDLPLMIIITILMGYVLSIRPSSVSVILTCLVIIVCVGYVRGGSPALLLFLPVITAIHANVHVSMAPFDVLASLLILLPSWIHDLRHGRDRMRREFLIRLGAGILQACALMATPYGIPGVIYSVIGSRVATYGGFIDEMKPMYRADALGGCIAALILTTILLAMILRSRRPGWEWMITSIASLALVLGMLLIAIRLMYSIFIPMAVLAGLLPEPMRMRRTETGVMTLGSICMVIVVILFGGFLNLNESKYVEVQTPTDSVSWIRRHVPQGSVIGTFSNYGGIVELAGYRVTVDMRPELFARPFASADYYQDYVDAESGSTADMRSYITRTVRRTGAHVWIAPYSVSTSGRIPGVLSRALHDMGARLAYTHRGVAVWILPAS